MNAALQPLDAGLTAPVKNGSELEGSRQRYETEINNNVDISSIYKEMGVDLHFAHQQRFHLIS